MNDLYLKFTSSEEADQLLFDTIENYVDENGMPMQVNQDGNYHEGLVVKTEKRPKFKNIDIIGDIYRPTGETTILEGEQTPVLEKLDGYHVNIRVIDEDVSLLQKYIVVPKAPIRVWG